MLTCGTISELPSNISTMGDPETCASATEIFDLNLR